MVIKNIVFDVGNVLLDWDSIGVTSRIFPNEPNPKELAHKLFKSETWHSLNLGKITEKEICRIYQEDLGIPYNTLEVLMQTVKESLIPVEGSLELLDKIHKAGYSLYSLTDNVKELMIFLKEKYDFWEKFQGIVVSAEIGILKPSEGIYKYLLETYGLNPSETLFIDDLIKNVEGAQNIGMYAVQFTNSKECEEELRNKYGIKI